MKIEQSVLKERMGIKLDGLSLPSITDQLASPIILAAVLSAAALYLWPAPAEFPMDDAYIHLVYAESLVEQGQLFFSDPKEKGVGASSILWVLLLGLGKYLGLSLVLTAKILGIGALIVLGCGLYRLMRPHYPPWLALAAALLVVLSGHLLWFALSGMETVLFLALGILALLAYRKQSWGWMGVLLGLLVLTRVEGVLLAIVIGAIDIWRHRSIRRGLYLAGSVCALICLPWIIYLWLRTGYPLPTSGVGKRFSTITLLQLATSSSPAMSWLSQYPALTYPLSWLGYTIEFALGGYALPAPYINIGVGLKEYNYRLSVWALLGLATVIVPLLWLSLRRLVKYIRTPGWMQDERRLPFVILLAWTAIHNLSYMLYLPSIGTASRYAALNHILLWLGLVTGIWYASSQRSKLWLAAGLAAIVLANTGYWNQVYDANIEHMRDVRIAAAHHLREHIPGDAICAAIDIGALRYFSGRPIIDLAGLIEPGASQWYLDGRFDAYLLQKNVNCLVLPGVDAAIGNQLFDVASGLGLSHSRLLTLNQVAVYAIDRQRWLTGYLPTMNYQPLVKIYRVTKQMAETP